MRWALGASLVMGLVLAAPALVRADDDAEMKALIEKAIKAHGGADKLNKQKATTMKFKGKIYAVGDGLEPVGGELGEECVEVSEMPVQHAVGDPGLAGDGPGAQARRAGADKEPVGRGEQLLADFGYRYAAR